jgi:tight adherence protein B
MQLLILALVFVGTLGVVVGAYVITNRRTLATHDAALRRLREVDETPESIRSILRDTNVSNVPMLDRLLAGREVTRTVTVQLQRAGLDMTPGSFLLRLSISAVAGMVLSRMISTAFVTPVIGVLLGAALPLLWLRSKQRARLKTFQDQLPEAIDMLVSAMKAGYSFQAAMKFIGEEVTVPLGPEFARFYEEQRLGMDVRTALIE